MRRVFPAEVISVVQNTGDRNRPVLVVGRHDMAVEFHPHEMEDESIGDSGLLKKAIFARKAVMDREWKESRGK